MEFLNTNRTFGCTGKEELEESFLGLITALQSSVEVRWNANATESYKTEHKYNEIQT